MDDNQHTIGLTELLDEVNRDLEALVKKHPSDYGVKTITMWWELERDRLVTRHSPESVVKKLRRAQNLKQVMAWFFVGCLAMLGADAGVRILFR